MYKFITLFLSGISIVASGSGQAPASSNPMLTQLDKEIDKEVRQFIRSDKPVGLVVGVLKNGKTIFYGYGETQKGKGQLPDGQTIFGIASLTKTFTATLLALAVNEGKLKLDDPVNKYLPDSVPPLEYQGVPITLQTLANHTSGLPFMPSNFHDPYDAKSLTGGSYRSYSDSDLFSFYVHFTPKRKPGGRFVYSNLGMATLGVILTRIYQKDYESLVREKICDPLGMNNTRQSFPSGNEQRIATGYIPDGRPATAWDWNALVAAGGLWSDAADLLTYANANMGKAPAELGKAMMLTHQATGNNIGLGWQIFKRGDNEWIMHDGNTFGFSSFMVIDTRKKIAIVIQANNTTPKDDLADAVITAAEK